ncbi:MAG TPA: TonB family protein [Bacteroidetes bacterium]|nr:TonB family protein [Bacteroidota bacterium]
MTHKMNMKQLLILSFLFTSTFLFSQIGDTTVYKVLEEMPRFPGCEGLDTTVHAKNQCAQTALLLFFNQNIVYPLDARNQNLEGQVVISFVVEKDGYISNAKVLRDIGGGCGEEALRVAKGMNEALKSANLKWRPGMNGGLPVRSQFTLPIKFKLQDPLDFVLANSRDTVYVVVDDSLKYKSGDEGLAAFLESHLKTPRMYQDSCKVGQMDLSLLARPDGYVKVIDMTDYWNLGVEFQWEAIRAATATWGQWIPAKRKGREVPSSYDFTVQFLPEGAGCQQVVNDYKNAVALADEGSRLYNEGQKEAGIAKLSEAIKLFPENANFLYLRGQAYMNMDKKEEACEDFRKVHEMASIPFVEQLMPLLCK